MFVDTSIQLYFYPRPPRGGRPHIVGLPSKNRVISIHALREEGDYGRFSQLVKVIKFLSTPSARRATTARPASRSCAKNFYPRPPRGGRRTNQAICQLGYQFLSTPSARRATSLVFTIHIEQRISIHALREEGDCPHPRCQAAADDFYPRPPRGGRPFPPPSGMSAKRISIHALREEGDPVFWYRPRSVLEFLSTPSARRATRIRRWDSITQSYFYPRPPRGGRHGVRRLDGKAQGFLSTPSARRATLLL